ncbi:MAG: FHA domain-containing protein [Anaerolineae bacterium]|jgi:pSer/pThr/pTyr-binding forkhead associated (FHA) protein|nr:FHA domain-containing protein [Anaerolineae bacterium]
MTPELVLLIFRVVSGLLLLAFLGGLAWLIYRDMQITAAAMAEQERPYGRLRIIANEAEQPPVNTTYILLPITSIGRSASNTIVLPDGYASAEHALIIRRQGQWWLEDQGSRNGTLLNEVAVQKAAVISAGDVIAVGGTLLKLEL